MATGQTGSVIGPLRRAALLRDGAGMADGALLECFLVRREEAAFEALVRRHGPMVLGVCRRILGNAHDAEDAFQATFLVLVRKAAALRSRETVGNWLYGVAYRTALKARASAMKRRAKESQARHTPRPEAAGDAVRDWQPLLDEELSRLPDHHREAVVLCELEGKTRREAARQLGIPEGTLSGRLTTARRTLARRLARRGVTLSAAALAAGLSRAAAPASVPAPLLASTVKAAALLAAGQAVTAAPVAALMEGVLKAMFLNKLKSAVVLLVLLGALGAGAGMLARPAGAAGQADPQPPAPKAKAPGPARVPIRMPALLKEVREAADAIEDKQWKAWMLESVAEAQAKAGDRAAAARTFQDAIKVAREITHPSGDPSPCYQTLGQIAAAQARAGDVKGADKTAEGIEDDGNRDYAQANVACARARAGDLEGALKAAGDISANKRDWVLLAVVRTQAGAGKVREAIKTAEEIGGDGERAEAAVAIARAQAKAGDRAAARKSLATALEIARAEDPKFDKRHYAAASVAEVQAEMGDLKAARRTADAITKKPWKDIALRHIVQVQAKAGDIKGALKTAEAIGAEYYKGEALKEVVVAQARSGDFKGGLRTLDGIPSVFWRVEALAEVAKVQAKAGDRVAAARTFQQAFAAAGADGEKVRDEEPGVGNLRNSAFCRILQAQAEVGEEREAFAWARKQRPGLLRTQALLSIAWGVARRAEAEKRPAR